MLIIAGWLRVDPDARAAYLDGCAAVVSQARDAPGCLGFALTADLLDPARIDVYERWETDEQLLAFRGSGSDGGQVAQILDAEVLEVPRVGHRTRLSQDTAIRALPASAPARPRV